MNLNELYYTNLACNTLAERLKKAKLIKGINQKQLSKITSLDRSTICEIERGSRDNISRDTLLKLIKVLDKNILCDDYLLFILNQEENISLLIEQHGISKLCNILKCHHSSIYRWKSFKNQIPKSKYNLIKELDQDN